MIDHSIYTSIAIAAESLNDIERARIATKNRLEAAEREATTHSPEAEALLWGMFDQLAKSEKDAIGSLTYFLELTPLWDWIDSTVGIGTKTMGRLVGAIGDPAWNAAEQRPRRGPAELWAYCGYHVIDGARPRRQRGVQANWNSEAKMRAFLCAESCLKAKARSPYGPLYDSARERATTKVHAVQCQNHKRPPAKSNGCGTQAAPELGAPGSPWRDGHQHAYALGIVAKEILKDMWREAGGVGSRQPAVCA